MSVQRTERWEHVLKLIFCDCFHLRNMSQLGLSNMIIEVTLQLWLDGPMVTLGPWIYAHHSIEFAHSSIFRSRHQSQHLVNYLAEQLVTGGSTTLVTTEFLGYFQSLSALSHRLAPLWVLPFYFRCTQLHPLFIQCLFQ